MSKSYRMLKSTFPKHDRTLTTGRVDFKINRWVQTVTNLTNDAHQIVLNGALRQNL